MGSGGPAGDIVDRHPLVERVENMTTASIERVRGVAPDGTGWTAVAKTLRPASGAPAFAFIPEEFHDQVLADLDWLDEPRVYRCGLGDRLPDGVRMPALLAVEEDADRLTLWLEDVADAEPWDRDRYRRTAHALGRLAGRWTAAQAEHAFGLGRRDINRLFHGKIQNHDLVVQGDDAFWRTPAVAAVADDAYRADVFRLAELTPALLARLDDLPHGVCHGDACPANFLEPGDGTIVGIDWSYCHVGPVGSDLGQLLAGRFESGAADGEDPAEVAATILEGFGAGLAAEGAAVDRAAVEQAFVTHLAVRSLFSLLIVEEGAPADLLRPRVALGRFGLDLALRSASHVLA
jgi:hypothetical protein